MKNKISIVVAIIGGLSFSGIAAAECASTLPYEQLVDCIVVEGSGSIHSKSTFEEDGEKSRPTQTSKTETQNNNGYSLQTARQK